MDEEGAPLSESVQVVDPDVRAHVYSLVTAVSRVDTLLHK
jgi:replication fork protection complex subunit Tof1/Swi1